MFPILICDENLQQIPDSFVMKYGKNMQEHVRIEVPTGQVWSMKLKKIDGHVWLHNGWTEFASFYSIRHMSFLLFKYEGDSYFDAFIFGPNCLEIDYPFLNDHHKSGYDSEFHMPDTEGTDIDTSSSSDDDYEYDYIFPTNHKGKGKLPMDQSPRPKKSNSNFGYLPTTCGNRNTKFSYPRVHIGGFIFAFFEFIVINYYN